jgi:hypothetical protein
MGDALSSGGNASEALASQRRALSVAEGYAAREPADPTRFELARYQRAVGLAQASAGDGAASLESLGKALATTEALAAANPASADFRAAVALDQLDLGRANASLARWRQARSWFQKSLDGWTELKRSGFLQQPDSGRIDEATRGVAQAAAALGSAP